METIGPNLQKSVTFYIGRANIFGDNLYATLFMNYFSSLLLPKTGSLEELRGLRTRLVQLCQNLFNLCNSRSF